MDMNRNMGAAVPAQLETAWAGHVDGSRLTFWLAGAATGHASSLSALTTGISLRLLPNRQKVICVDDERARKEKSRAHTQASDSLSRSSPSHSHARPQSARNKISTTLQLYPCAQRLPTSSTAVLDCDASHGVSSPAGGGARTIVSACRFQL